MFKIKCNNTQFLFKTVILIIARAKFDDYQYIRCYSNQYIRCIVIYITSIYVYLFIPYIIIYIIKNREYILSKYLSVIIANLYQLSITSLFFIIIPSFLLLVVYSSNLLLSNVKQGCLSAADEHCKRQIIDWPIFLFCVS